MNIYQFSGDLGDALAIMPIIRHLGGGEYVLAPHVGPGAPREPMTESRAKFILSLIAAQPYITSARFEEHPTGVTHDFSGFRATSRHNHGELLTHWQARHFGIEAAAVDMSPWLTVKPSPAAKGMTVIARSLRYHNPRFDWRRVISKGFNAMFIGLHDEHEHFTKHNGAVSRITVADALEMAELIAGSDMFIGNQSFPCWVAMGLGHPLIQETSPHHPNSRVVRPNARFAIGVYPSTLTPAMSYVDAYTQVAETRREPWELDIETDQADADWARKALRSPRLPHVAPSLPGKSKWIAIHAGQSWDGRSWPVDRWNAVARHIKAKGFKVLLVGHGNEMTVGDMDARERVTLGQLAALLSFCDTFIGTDSLPLRVAASQRVKSLGLLGANIPDLPDNVSIMTPAILRNRLKNPMLAITVEMVVSKL